MAYLLGHLLSESIHRFPDRQAVVCDGESMSYGELEKLANKLAMALRSEGVTRGDRVGIFLNKSIASIISVFGVLKAGATYVPIDRMAPPKRISYLVENCGIKCILTSQDKIQRIDQAVPEDLPLNSIILTDGSLDQSVELQGSMRLLQWEAVLSFDDQGVSASANTDSDVAYILYTSGSTGNPKGVMISHLNALTFVNMAHEFFNIEKEDRLSNHAPLHFDLSVFDIFTALKAGATLIIVPEKTSLFPVKLAECIQNNRITVWNSVPSALSLLAARVPLDNYDFAALRLILFAGEIFPVKHLRVLKKHIPRAEFYNMYGQTEANSSTYFPVGELPPDDQWRIPIGKAFPNFEVFALDENQRKIEKPGEEGELYVRGSSVAQGYWGDPQKTAASFVDNGSQPHYKERIYKTGDLVTLDEGGNYIFIGRKDHMIKSRGYRVEIGEIETTLYSHPRIREAAVVPIPDELIGNRIVAFLVPETENILRIEDVIDFCSERIPKYMIPESIEFRKSLPKTSTGKVDKNLLAAEISLESLRMRG
ncbi:MAG: amino acid adenylation domain-containing protein [Candidatus Hodarchaeota archaeon]